MQAGKIQIISNGATAPYERSGNADSPKSERSGTNMHSLKGETVPHTTRSKLYECVSEWLTSPAENRAFLNSAGCMATLKHIQILHLVFLVIVYGVYTVYRQVF